MHTIGEYMLNETILVNAHWVRDPEFSLCALCIFSDGAGSRVIVIAISHSSFLMFFPKQFSPQLGAEPDRSALVVHLSLTFQ